MRLFLNEKDEKKKSEIRNVIVLGTLEHIYQFLKQSIFINIICNWFDMEDVINATVEAWINYISKGSIYSKAYMYDLNSSYILYSQYFLNHILGNLNSRKDCSAGDFSSKELHNLTNWYYLYLKESKNNPNFSYENFKKMVIETSDGNDERLRKIYDIFKYLNRVLKIDDSLVNIDTINSLKVLLYNLVNMTTLENSLTWDEVIMIDRLLDHDLIGQIFELLTPKQREILFKLFVEGKTEIRVAKENNVCRQNVIDLKRRTLEKIKKKYQDLETECI